jgi:hypothetical protein
MKHYEDRQVEEHVMGRACSKKEDKKSACRLLVAQSERKRPVRKLRRRWVDHVEMDLEDIGWNDVDWIGLAQDRGQWGTFRLWFINIDL